MMAHLALILKIVLCASVFITAFLSVFKRTIDDQKRLTGYGKASVACVCVTFCMGIANELLSQSKEAQSAANKRISDDRAMIVQVKLDQALDDGRKRGEEAKAYMLEADDAHKRLEAVQKQLLDIDARVSDPTVKRLIGEVSKLAKSDITLTGEQLATVLKTLVDVHGDLGEVRMIAVEDRDAAKGVRNELASVKLEIDAIRSDVVQIKASTAPKPRQDSDAGFLDSGSFFVDDGRLDAN